MPTLKLKIPPPIVAATAILLMWLVARSTPQFSFPLPAHRLLACCAFAAGLAVALAAVISFRHARTTVNPLHPERASSLVTSGIYRFTRNPMYLGLLCALLAAALFLSNVLTFLLLPAFVLYMNYFQILPEERALSATFGETFQAYKSSVRRWL